MNPADVNGLVVCFMVLAFMLWLTPDCNEEACEQAHAHHSVAQRTAAIERRHATFHGPTNPDPLCSLCQARKRDDREP